MVDLSIEEKHIPKDLKRQGNQISKWKKRVLTYVQYSKKVDKGSVAWVSMCLYSSTNFRVHFSTIVMVCNGEGSATQN
jgi:hypothetical protein